MKTFYSIIFIMVVLFAFLIRIQNLGLRPMHNDEANQAYKFTLLHKTGDYKYDPFEHHGPSLYYLSLPIAWLTVGGDANATTEGALRLLSVIFCVGLIILLYFMIYDIGWFSVINIGILTAVSPLMVYFSRFYIQEMLFVFFTFGSIIFIYHYLQTKKTKWIIFAGAMLGMIHATKETCIITYFSMVMSLIVLYGINYLRNEKFDFKLLNKRDILYGVLTAMFVSIIFFSSFFTNFHGIVDSIFCYKYYFTRGAGQGTNHVQPWYFYLHLLGFFRYGREGIPLWKDLYLFLKGVPLVWSEIFIFLLSIFGMVKIFSKKNLSDKKLNILRFFAIYAIIMLTVYSLIPYKTPWCMLSFWHGFIILAGYGASSLICSVKNIYLKVLFILFLLFGTQNLLTQSYWGNTRYYADYRHPYVYAHTTTHYLKMIKRINSIAEVHEDKKGLYIQAIAKSAHYHWPLCWYLKSFSKVAYYNSTEQKYFINNGPVYVTPVEDTGALKEKLEGKYITERYGLRPGVLIALHIRQDLWDKFLKTR